MTESNVWEVETLTLRKDNKSITADPLLFALFLDETNAYWLQFSNKSSVYNIQVLPML